MAPGDVLMAQDLAQCGAMKGLGQSAVVAATLAVARELDAQLVLQLRLGEAPYANHYQPLRETVDRIDVAQALGAFMVALLHSVDAKSAFPPAPAAPARRCAPARRSC